MTAVQLTSDLSTATARFFRVLGHPMRLAIVELLMEQPRSVSELIDALDAPQSRVSNHLACLRWCGFVETERLGRQVIYRLLEIEVRDVLEAASGLASKHREHLASCSRIGPEWI